MGVTSMAYRAHTGDMLEVHRLAAAILCVGQHDKERHTRILLANTFAYRVVMLPPHAPMSILPLMAYSDMHGSGGRDDSFWIPLLIGSPGHLRDPHMLASTFFFSASVRMVDVNWWFRSIIILITASAATGAFNDTFTATYQSHLEPCILVLLVHDRSPPVRELASVQTTY